MELPKAGLPPEAKLLDAVGIELAGGLGCARRGLLEAAFGIWLCYGPLSKYPG